MQNKRYSYGNTHFLFFLHGHTESYLRTMLKEREKMCSEHSYKLTTQYSFVRPSDILDRNNNVFFSSHYCKLGKDVCWVHRFNRNTNNLMWIFLSLHSYWLKCRSTLLHSHNYSGSYCDCSSTTNSFENWRGSPVDDRPSTNKLHHFVQKKKNNNKM